MRVSVAAQYRIEGAGDQFFLKKNRGKTEVK
jgi:hypothetical protein